MHQEAIGDQFNAAGNCDYGCARRCFEEYRNSSVLDTFVSCLAPQCNCVNSFAISSLPIQKSFNKTDFWTRVDDKLREVSDRVSEGWPTSIRKTLNEIEGYDVLRDCDTQCHQECFELKKYVPFDVLLQCPRYRCNCWYTLADPIST